METTIRPFFLTTIGKKYLMALTGLLWAGFIFSHMAGNLLMLISPDLYNSYGHMITSGNLIYFIEALLIASILTHILCAISLTKMNQASGGAHRYAKQTNGEKAVTKASKTMAIQGSIILVFIISHISTFKYGEYYETTVNNIVMRDLYRLIFEVFHKPGFIFWYLISLVLLGFHLSHGFGSLFQSLGIKNNRFAQVINKLSILYAVVVAGGFIIQPIYIYFFAK